MGRKRLPRKKTHALGGQTGGEAAVEEKLRGSAWRKPADVPTSHVRRGSARQAGGDSCQSRGHGTRVWGPCLGMMRSAEHFSGRFKYEDASRLGCKFSWGPRGAGARSVRSWARPVGAAAPLAGSQASGGQTLARLRATLPPAPGPPGCARGEAAPAQCGRGAGVEKFCSLRRLRCGARASGPQGWGPGVDSSERREAARVGGLPATGSGSCGRSRNPRGDLRTARPRLGLALREPRGAESSPGLKQALVVPP